jgi:hypothetical protein
VILTVSSSAQQSSSRGLPDDPAKAQQQQDTNRASTQQSPNARPPATSDDRLFWTLPNYLSVRTGNVPPLTAGQKFKVVARTAFDPVEYPYMAFLAGISQASDSEPGYGQGAAGYGKRFGAAFADSVDENFWTGAILPSLFRQDPRYYQLGEGSFKRRLAYAVTRNYITRGDSGRTQFNCSEVLGSGITAGIGLTYRPESDRTVGNAISIWVSQLGWDTMALGFKEFWPDIHRHFSKNKTTVAPPETVPASNQGENPRKQN